MFKGTLVKKELEFHQKYGQLFRIAPNELSITKEEAQIDMHATRPGHQIPGKDPLWYQSAADAVPNLITSTNPEVHARMRNLIKGSFSEQTLRSQQPLIESYGDLFVERLRAMATAAETGGRGAAINIVDIIGDLALGESFHCLRDSCYHPWVQNLYQFFAGMNMAVAPRFYPLIDALVQRMLPASIMEAVRQHIAFVDEKIEKRLNMETSRPDFMTYFMKDNVDFKNMSMAEIQSSFALIIAAGSETTATTLCGTINYLIRPEYRPVLQKLIDEIRNTYKSEADITIDSTVGLPYLIATLNEGLRLCNPVPGGLYRQTPKGGTVIAGEYIPEYTSIAIRPFCVARDPELFTRPTEFVPERWLPEGQRPKEFANDKRDASQPFSIGTYNCLGKPIAWAELRLLLTRFLWAFDVEEEPGKGLVWDDQEMLVMVHKKPFFVRIKAREGAKVV
ncbi:MAG: RNA polymerase II mediator complex subunit [Stictis urceolatum]|nr:RNA polymerase II mediator complex subunit [Stictis urceolata]